MCLKIIHFSSVKHNYVLFKYDYMLQFKKTTRDANASKEVVERGKVHPRTGYEGPGARWGGW
jgi:hypothetical protein